MVDNLNIAKRLIGAEFFSDDIAIDSQICIGVKNRRLKCRKCVEICSNDAITLEGKEVSVDQDSCTHCGACVTVCPIGAVKSNWLSWRDLLRNALQSMVSTNGRPILACDKVLEDAGDFDRAKVLTLRCLERIDEALLLTLFAGGASEIRLVSGDCKNCKTGCFGAVWTLICDYVLTQLDVIGLGEQKIMSYLSELPQDAYEIDKASFSNESLSRRDLFGGAKREAMQTVSDIIDEVVGSPDVQRVAAAFGLDVSGSAIEVASRGQICAWALESLSHIGSASSSDSVSSRAPQIPSRIFGDIEISSTKCTNCFLCTAYCPTKAIEKNLDGHKVLGFIVRPLLCVQCGACQDVCKSNAISLINMVSLDQVTAGLPKYINYADQDRQKHLLD